MPSLNEPPTASRLMSLSQASTAVPAACLAGSPVHQQQMQQELGMALGTFNGVTQTGEGERAVSVWKETEMHLSRNTHLHLDTTRLRLLNQQGEWKRSVNHTCQVCSLASHLHEDDSQRLTAQRRFKQPLRAGTLS